jgi:hypothetical protein
MLCNNTRVGNDEYRGLDSNRDTEEEVETAIRLFPEVLSKPNHFYDVDIERWDKCYPIQLLTFTREDGFYTRREGRRMCNMKAISFIPLLASLSDEQDRRGLLSLDYIDKNILQNLMCSEMADDHSQVDYGHIDDKYLQVLIQLRQMGLLKKKRHSKVQSFERIMLSTKFPRKEISFFS